MPRLSARKVLLAALVGAAVASACAKAESPLAAHPGDEGAAGAAQDGGAEASAGAASVDASDGSTGPDGFVFPDADADADAASDAPEDVPPDVFVDPDGPPVLRFLHGVVDADVARLCLLGWNGAIVGDAAPVPKDGLAFGGVVDVDVTSDLAASAVRPFVVTGDPGGVTSCAQIVASPPKGARVAALPALPAGTLAAKRALLLVAAGCVGGTTLADATSACGSGYDATNGNPRMVLVETSRLPPPDGDVGLQVVHASWPMGPITANLVPIDGPPLAIATGISFGDVAPRPPLETTPTSAFGTQPAMAQAAITQPSGAPLFTAPLAGPTAEQLAAGANLALVVIGARPGSPADGGTGNPATVVWLPAPK